MDFGFGTFLEKFEQHFGPRWTKPLLVVLALAAASAAFGLIWTWILNPLLLVFGISPTKSAPAQILSIAFGALQLFASFGFVSMILDARRKRAVTEQMESALIEARAELAETRQLFDEARAYHLEAKEATGHARELMALSIEVSDSSINHAVAIGAITDEQAVELRSLRDIVVENHP